MKKLVVLSLVLLVSMFVLGGIAQAAFSVSVGRINYDPNTYRIPLLRVNCTINGSNVASQITITEINSSGADIVVIHQRWTSTGAATFIVEKGKNYRVDAKRCYYDPALGYPTQMIAAKASEEKFNVGYSTNVNLELGLKIARMKQAVAQIVRQF